MAVKGFKQETSLVYFLSCGVILYMQNADKHFWDVLWNSKTEGNHLLNTVNQEAWFRVLSTVASTFYNYVCLCCHWRRLFLNFWNDFSSVTAGCTWNYNHYSLFWKTKKRKLRNSVKQSVKVAQECQSDFANVLLIVMRSSEMIQTSSRNLNSVLIVIMYLYDIWSKLETHL